HLLGVAAHQTNRHGVAVDYILRAIAINNSSALYHCNLGAAYRGLNQVESAIASFRTAIAIDQEFAGAHFNLAMTFESLGQLDEAAAEYREAIRIDPTFAVAHFNLGNLLAAAESHAEAIDAYESAMRFAPDVAEVYNNLGTSLMAIGRPSEAADRFREALRLKENYAEAHNNLGSAQQWLGDFDGAEKSFRHAIKLQPGFSGALTNLGNIENERGCLESAIASYLQAIETEPDSAEARFNLSLARLRGGDFDRGWSEYGWRFRKKVTPRDFVEPLWNGEDLASQTILAYAEQGIGDEIQFASCLPDLIARCRHCVVECDPRLVKLFSRSFPKAKVLSRPVGRDVDRQVNPSVDYQVPFGSLPRHFRACEGEFPFRRAFLAADPDRVKFLRRTGAPTASAVNVGISWIGGNDEAARRKRSIPLSMWTSVLLSAGIQFVSLQYGDCKSELAAVQRSIGVGITSPGSVDFWNDLDGLAAQIVALDLVITVDNSTAHLAGALGVPVWTIVPFASDWRWQMHRETSPWYPSMRLFRQEAPADWIPVLSRVAAELSAQFSSRSS
ncbi:MAG: tetratricopeptide repeat protein, partial [Planctomycetaceae bacterium]